jgi:hypothetical protein
MILDKKRNRYDDLVFSIEYKHTHTHTHTHTAPRRRGPLLRAYSK